MAKHSDDFSKVPHRGPGLLLLLAASRWRFTAESTFEESGLSAIKTLVLLSTHALHTKNGPANQVDIARYAGLDVMTMSKNVRILEAQSLVKRTTNPTDSRARTVELTKEGTVKLKKVVKGLDAIDDVAFDDLGGVQKLRKTLSAYIGNTQ